MVADAPATVEVGDVRRARRPTRTRSSRRRCCRCAAGFAGVERERRRARSRSARRSCPDRSERAALPGSTRAPRPRAATRAPPRRGSPSRSLQDPHRRVVDRLELVGGHDLGRPVAEARLRPRPLLGQPAPLVACPATRAPALERSTRGRVHVRHAGLLRWRERAAPGASLTIRDASGTNPRGPTRGRGGRGRR